MRRHHPGMAAEARRVVERSRSALRQEAAGQVVLPFARSYPVSAPAVVEQLVVPIGTTNELRYQEWRRSELGQQVFAAVRQRALGLVATGEMRIGTKALFEWVRSNHHLECNNTFTSFVARELRDTEPTLRAAIECRTRKST